jgi:FkbM family methyltransferase
MENEGKFSRILAELDEPVDAAEYRVRHLLDDSMKDNRIIVHGAGNIGRKAAKVLCADGRRPLCFTDTNEKVWGNEICGIPVFSPQEAIKKFGADCLFIAAVFNREPYSDFRTIFEYFQERYSIRIFPYTYLAWRYPDALLPHFAQGTPKDVMVHKDAVVSLYNSFTDQRSRELFLEFIAVSLTADYVNFSAPDKSIQYFPPEVVASLPDQITFADCGSYDGDTLRDFLGTVGSERLLAYHAFEPDEENFYALKMFIGTLPTEVQHKIYCYNCAVGDNNENIRFNFTGTESSTVVTGRAAGHIGGGGNVRCVTLDAVLYNKNITMIKMDIEGYELQALSGAENVIKRDDPVLAISIYHKPTDFITIPKMLNFTQHICFLRRYMSYFYDSIYYRMKNNL